MIKLIKKQIFYIGICGFVAMLFMTIPTYAAKNKKPIDNVSIKITGKIEADTNIGEEDLSITTGGSNYSFVDYDVLNQGFKWSMEDVPQIVITLQADDYYYFNIRKSSQISISGGSYITATRENGSSNLVVTVKLPALNTQVAKIESANLDEDGNMIWDSAAGAGAYEIRMIRGSAILDGTQIVSNTKFNMSQYFTKEGTYKFKVRPINYVDTSVKGPWTDSNDIYINHDRAKYFRENYEKLANNGTWYKDDYGWYYVLDNGKRVFNEWKKIKGEWYYFYMNGYMATGWVNVDNNWYYLDPQNGNMWKNTTTPDGYQLTINGTRVVK